MTLTLGNLIFILEELERVQDDQLRSVWDGSTDPDDYNHNALREIHVALKRIQNRLDPEGDDVVDLWGEIVHVETMMEGEA